MQQNQCVSSAASDRVGQCELDRVSEHQRSCGSRAVEPLIMDQPFTCPPHHQGSTIAAGLRLDAAAAADRRRFVASRAGRGGYPAARAGRPPNTLPVGCNGIRGVSSVGAAKLLKPGKGSGSGAG